MIGIPVAAGVFYTTFGWKLNPMFAAAAMSLSSVTVVTNALRLRSFQPKTLKVPKDHPTEQSDVLTVHKEEGERTMKMSIMTKANKAAKRLGISPSWITHIHDLSEVSSEGAKGLMIMYQVADEKYAVE